MATSEGAEETQAASSEYEREPVAVKAHLGFKSFIGMYAGEHCAGTELMIGPLFVAAGASAFDLVIGLLSPSHRGHFRQAFLCHDFPR